MRKIPVKALWLGVFVVVAGCASDKRLTQKTGRAEGSPPAPGAQIPGGDTVAPEPGTRAFYDARIKGRYALDDGRLLAMNATTPSPQWISPRWTEGRVLQIIDTNMVAMGRPVTNASGVVVFRRDGYVRLNGIQPPPCEGEWFRVVTLPDGEYRYTVASENRDWAPGESLDTVTQAVARGFRQVAQPTFEEYRQVYERDCQAAAAVDPIVSIRRETNAPPVVRRTSSPSSDDVLSYAERQRLRVEEARRRMEEARQRAEAERRTQEERTERLTGEALQKHLRAYNMDIIRTGKGLPLPIELTPEETAQLTAEGFDVRELRTPANSEVATPVRRGGNPVEQSVAGGVTDGGAPAGPEPGSRAFYEQRIRGKYVYDAGELVAVTTMPTSPNTQPRPLPLGSTPVRTIRPGILPKTAEWIEGRVLRVFEGNKVVLGKAAIRPSGAVVFPPSCVVDTAGRRDPLEKETTIRLLAIRTGMAEAVAADGSSTRLAAYRETFEPTFEQYREVYEHDLAHAIPERIASLAPVLTLPPASTSTVPAPKQEPEGIVPPPSRLQRPAEPSTPGSVPRTVEPRMPSHPIALESEPQSRKTESMGASEDTKVSP